MVIELYHHPQSPPSVGVRMLLRELDVEYIEHEINFFAQQHKSEEYKKINPYMQIPAIKDGDFVLFESRAIAIYLCNKYDKTKSLYPTDVAQAAKMNAKLFRDVDHIKAMIEFGNIRKILAGIGSGPDESLLPKRAAVLSEYDALLAENDYLFGNHLTILDFFATGTMTEIALVGFDGWDEYPNLKKWRERLQNLSYFEEIVAKPEKLSTKMYKEFCDKNSATMKHKK